jgi:transposase
MISLPATVRMFLCAEPVDMRKSFDGLFGLVESALALDPLSGHLFLFLNKRRDRIKLLFWERDGLVIWYKRLEAGTFQWPRFTPDATSVELSMTDLSLLLSGVDVESAQRRKRYRRAG